MSKRETVWSEFIRDTIQPGTLKPAARFVAMRAILVVFFDKRF